MSNRYKNENNMKTPFSVFVKGLFLSFCMLLFHAYSSVAQIIIIPPRSPRIIITTPQIIIAPSRGFRKSKHFWGGGRKFNRKMHRNRDRNWRWRRW
jgi:hypothetical protein